MLGVGSSALPALLAGCAPSKPVPALAIPETMINMSCLESYPPSSMHYGCLRIGRLAMSVRHGLSVCFHVFHMQSSDLWNCKWYKHMSVPVMVMTGGVAIRGTLGSATTGTSPLPRATKRKIYNHSHKIFAIWSQRTTKVL